LAGDGIGGYKEGTGTDARFKNEEGIAVDAAAMYMWQIRIITVSGKLLLREK